ncbi:hypothetical protein [Mycetohabitans sp. B8]|uniref:hypothetical protein n=1 Tax=Mycetohabitans sp. B8 TaxID=2841845 RepID=UPI001F1BCA19|nr:hypothetical protein [Mycetohabitans sp. B8]
MTVEEATDRLAAQLLRQVDTTAASQGGWDQDASNYLNAYAATHPGETIGKDQWGNAVPLFGTAAGYQRNDSTIFSRRCKKFEMLLRSGAEADRGVA